MNKKLAVVLSGCAVLSLTLTACGGDSGQETDDWARSVCDEVQPQVRKIQDANLAIAEASEGDRSADEVREADAAAFQDISEAYAALASAVDEAGDPPVEDGEQLREDAVSELNGISDAYDGLRETIEELDSSDQGEFAEGLKGIAEQLEQLGQSGDDALSELQSGELGEAMARQEGCQSPGATPGAEQTDGEEGESEADEADEADEGAAKEDEADDS